MEQFKEQCEKNLNEKLASFKAQVTEWHDIDILKSNIKIQ